MTKYLVFKNQPDSEQSNVPGSSEEMASEIANVVSRDRMHPNYYIAFPVEHPSTSLESLKDLAKFSVEITDETWHSPNSVDKYYCQNLNGRNANAKSQIHK